MTIVDSVVCQQADSYLRTRMLGFVQGWGNIAGFIRILPLGSDPLLHCNWVLHSYQGELQWHKMFHRPFTNLARMSTGTCRGNCRLATNLLNVCSSRSSFAVQSSRLMRQDLRHDSLWTVHDLLVCRLSRKQIPNQAIVNWLLAFVTTVQHAHRIPHL